MARTMHSSTQPATPDRRSIERSEWNTALSKWNSLTAASIYDTPRTALKRATTLAAPGGSRFIIRPPLDIVSRSPQAVELIVHRESYQPSQETPAQRDSCQVTGKTINRCSSEPKPLTEQWKTTQPSHGQNARPANYGKAAGGTVNHQPHKPNSPATSADSSCRGSRAANCSRKSGPPPKIASRKPAQPVRQYVTPLRRFRQSLRLDYSLFSWETTDNTTHQDRPLSKPFKFSAIKTRIFKSISRLSPKSKKRESTAATKSRSISSSNKPVRLKIGEISMPILQALPGTDSPTSSSFPNSPIDSIPPLCPLPPISQLPQLSPSLLNKVQSIISIQSFSTISSVYLASGDPQDDGASTKSSEYYSIDSENATGKREEANIQQAKTPVKKPTASPQASPQLRSANKELTVVKQALESRCGNIESIRQPQRQSHPSIQFLSDSSATLDTAWKDIGATADGIAELGHPDEAPCESDLSDEEFRELEQRKPLILSLKKPQSEEQAADRRVQFDETTEVKLVPRDNIGRSTEREVASEQTRLKHAKLRMIRAIKLFCKTVEMREEEYQTVVEEKSDIELVRDIWLYSEKALKCRHDLQATRAGDYAKDTIEHMRKVGSANLLDKAIAHYQLMVKIARDEQFKRSRARHRVSQSVAGLPLKVPVSYSEL